MAGQRVNIKLASDVVGSLMLRTAKFRGFAPLATENVPIAKL
jgi:hypothetical protein